MIAKQFTLILVRVPGPINIPVNGMADEVARMDTSLPFSPSWKKILGIPLFTCELIITKLFIRDDN